MDRRRALLLFIRVVALVALVGILRADQPRPDVLGLHEERSQAISGSRSRRTHAILPALGLEAGAPIERSSSYVELTASVDPRGSMRVKERTVGPGRLPVLRAVGSAHDQLLVVGLDAQGRVRYAANMPDPTRIRAEFPDETGELHGEVIERDAEIDVRVPNDERITTARVYRADGSGTLLATFEVH